MTKKALHDEKIKDKILNTGEQFEIFWKAYPNGTSNGVSKKIVLEYYKRADELEDKIIEEVNLLNRGIEYGIVDQKYVKSCNNRIISFKQTTNIAKEKNLKRIISEFRKNPDKEKGERLKNDFGKDLVYKLDREIRRENDPAKAIMEKFK